MTDLIVLKEKLKNIYGKYDVIFDHAMKFLFALISLLVINGRIGYNARFANPLFAVLIAAVCTFLPGSATAVVCCVVIAFQLLSLSMEYAAIALVFFVIMFFLYFVFSPKTSYILLLTPLLFMFHIPYALPVIVGLTAGFAGIIPAAFGIYIYFVLDFASEFSAAASSFGADAIIQKIVFIVDNTIANREFVVLCVVFAATIMLVHIIKSLSLDYSWIIGIITGSIVEAILVIMSYLMLSLDFNMLMLIIGIVAAIAIGMALDFFIFSVDYTRTEYVQFEDEDYYYYVKAVPKFSVAETDVKVKKINARKGEEMHSFALREKYEEDMPDEDEIRKKAYEQDVVDLEEEE